MARTSNFANVATVTRASTKTDAGGWDFTSGGTVGTLTEYASGVAAIHSTAGLLVEESTTNEIRNPRAEGGTAGTIGSGGVIPTNYTCSQTGYGVAFGTEDGSPYMDLIFSSYTPSGDFALNVERSTQVAAVLGETWTWATGVKLISGSFANVDSVYLSMLERNSGGGALVNNFSADLEGSIDGTHRRFFVTATMQNASTAYAQPVVRLNHTSGSWTFTLRIYAPQLENKAYPTSPVFPTVSSPAASTRAADDVSVPNGAWSNDNGAGTLYIEAVLNSSGISGNFGTVGASYGADVSADYIRFRAAGSGSFNVVAEDNNTVVVSTIGQQSITGPAHAVYGAIAWDTNDVAASLRGKTQTFDTSATVGFGAAKLIFASGSSSTTFPSQYVKDVRYWPKRLTNAELEALVGN